MVSQGISHFQVIRPIKLFKNIENTFKRFVLSSIYQSIFPNYFSFVLQGTFVIYFTMFSTCNHFLTKKVYESKIGYFLWTFGQEHF